VGVVLVLGSERYKQGSRVRFVCGRRALDAFRARAAVLERLGSLLSAPLDGLCAGVERLLEQSERLQRRSRDLADRAIQGEARRLLGAVAERPALVVATFDGWPADELRSLALALVALEPCVALLASRGEKVQLAFAQSDGLPHDISGLLREAATRLGGKGGGKGNLAQGGGERLERLDEALAAAAARIRAVAGSGR
jgi:alanyl-tRNA synthetase